MDMETEWGRLLKAARIFVGCWTDSSFAKMVGYSPRVCGLEELLVWAVENDYAASKTILRDKKEDAGGGLPCTVWFIKTPSAVIANKAPVAAEVAPTVQPSVALAASAPIPQTSATTIIVSGDSDQDKLCRLFQVMEGGNFTTNEIVDTEKFGFYFRDDALKFLKRICRTGEWLLRSLKDWSNSLYVWNWDNPTIQVWGKECGFRREDAELPRERPTRKRRTYDRLLW